VGPLATAGATLPPPSALRFSQPLGGLLPTSPCGLVSSRWHAQAFPFRAFPFQGAVPPLGGLLPSCRYLRLSSSLRRRRTVDPTSGPCSPWKSVALRAAVNRPGARCPPGFFPLQGSTSFGRGPRFREPPLPSLGRGRTRRPREPAPQGLPEPKARLVSRETVDPLEVPDLVEPLTRSKARSDLAYRFTGGGTRRHRRTAPPPWVRTGHLPQPSEYSCRSTSLLAARGRQKSVFLFRG